MPVIAIEMFVRAPIERCFDLCRSVDLHAASTTGTSERAVAGVTSGLMGEGDTVTWRARHFGITQDLTSRVIDVRRPTHFHSVLVRGAFKRFAHDHDFEEVEGGTIMRDRFDYDAPFGPLGALAEQLFLTRYMRRFLEERARVVKRVAESEEWKRYL
jgi:ligand-binding SRPBCC domain-containing protein